MGLVSFSIVWKDDMHEKMLIILLKQAMVRCISKHQLLPQR